jgi:plasmid stabilization system protein ParE
MEFTIKLTLAAIDDIQSAVDYYNEKSPDLGFKFADELDHSLQAVARMPNAYSYRYKNVRAKLLNKFPYLIFFMENESMLSIDVLRIFNTNQEPLKL